MQSMQQMRSNQGPEILTETDVTSSSDVSVFRSNEDRFSINSPSDVSRQVITLEEVC